MSGHHGGHGHVDREAPGAHLGASGELQLPALRRVAERLRALTAGRTVERVLGWGAAGRHDVHAR